MLMLLDLYWFYTEHWGHTRMCYVYNIIMLGFFPILVCLLVFVCMLVYTNYILKTSLKTVRRPYVLHLIKSIVFILPT